jgi:hypothetical protein
MGVVLDVEVVELDAIGPGKQVLVLFVVDMMGGIRPVKRFLLRCAGNFIVGKRASLWFCCCGD